MLATLRKGNRMTTTTLTAERILGTGFGFWASKTLLSAIELGLFTELAREPRSLSELRQQLGLHPRSAADFMDALVALGFVEKSADGSVYCNTPDTDFFLDREKPSYIGGLLEMANSRLYRYWGNLTDGLRTGEPQNEIKDGGLDLFSAMALNPERLRGFMRAMTGLSIEAAVAIARQFPWGSLRDLCRHRNRSGCPARRVGQRASASARRRAGPAECAADLRRVRRRAQPRGSHSLASR